MSTIAPVTFKLKSGKIGIVRSANPTDAAAIISLEKDVAAEQIYTLTQPEELSFNLEQKAKWIEDMNAHPSNLLLVATLDSQIIGMLDFSAGHRKRIAHTGDFGMSVAKPNREDGIGIQLLQTLLNWANQHSEIEKINLKVHSTNLRALGLYQKLGFKEEGRLHKDLKYSDTHYVDTVVMGKLLT